MDGLLHVLPPSFEERMEVTGTHLWLADRLTGLEQHEAIRRWPDTGSALNTLPELLTHRPR
jgi:hypothetical protein